MTCCISGSLFFLLLLLLASAYTPHPTPLLPILRCHLHFLPLFFGNLIQILESKASLFRFTCIHLFLSLFLLHLSPVSALAPSCSGFNQIGGMCSTDSEGMTEKENQSHPLFFPFSRSCFLFLSVLPSFQLAPQHLHRCISQAIQCFLPVLKRHFGKLRSPPKKTQIPSLTSSESLES